jgi:plasmid stabilization system protein ParE
MACIILWTKRAEKGFNSIVDYLSDEWTEKEFRVFVKETMQFIQLLAKKPHLLAPTRTHPGLYRGPVNKLTILTYRFDELKNTITLINFRDARRKPLK